MIYLGTPLLIFSGVISFESKFILLTIGGVFVYFALRILGFTNEALGIAKKNTLKSLKSVSFITIILLIASFVLYFSGQFKRFESTETFYFYLFYVFISCPIQEFLYRGAIPAILKKYVFSNWSILLISSGLYSFVHIIYGDFLTLIFTFFIGIIWLKCYEKSNNLVGVCLSHSILGIVTIFAGIIN